MFSKQGLNRIDKNSLHYRFKCLELEFKLGQWFFLPFEVGTNGICIFISLFN